MSTNNDDGKSGILGQGLPGTGGDFAPTDTDDVEGHRQQHGDDAQPDGVNTRRPVPSVDGDEQDTEGHLFHTGPTTQGEFSRRGPGENPHGDR